MAGTITYTLRRRDSRSFSSTPPVKFTVNIGARGRLVTASTWFVSLNHPVGRIDYMPRVPITFSILKAAGMVCSSGSGTLYIKKNGVNVVALSFGTSSGGPNDDRIFSVVVAENDSIEFQTVGTFTVFRGTLSGTRGVMTTIPVPSVPSGALLAGSDGLLCGGDYITCGA